MTELIWNDATEQARMVAAGEVSSRELVDAHLARIEAVNPTINAIIHERPGAACAEADAADAARSFSRDNPPFDGVPFGFKDLGCQTAGDPYHCGMQFLKDLGWTETEDAPLSARYKQAGLINLGRTNTPELGAGVTTEPLAYGPTRNPWSTEHSSGGSSGGSTAAVAAGMLPACHASDGGGSIRIPSSMSGVVGLKVQRGRIRGSGRESLELGHGVHGAVARSMRDVAALLDAVHGSHAGDIYRASPPARPYLDEVGADPGSLRIGMTTTTPAGGVPTDPACAEAANAAAKLLESLGHRVDGDHPAAIDDPAFTTNFSTFVAAGNRVWLDNLGRRIGHEIANDDMGPVTKTLIEIGSQFSAHDALTSLQWLQRYQHEVTDWWVDHDLLLTPTLPLLPPLLGVASTPDDPVRGLIIGGAYVSYTSPFNVTGQPALSLPLYESDSGLPIGVQLVAAPDREDVLIAVGAQLEAAAPWASRRPSI